MSFSNTIHVYIYIEREREYSNFLVSLAQEKMKNGIHVGILIFDMED